MPQIRVLYPWKSLQFVPSVVKDKCSAGQLPPEPTDAVPGTEAKIRVLEERAAGGFRLFHPDDFAPARVRGTGVDDPRSVLQSVYQDEERQSEE